MMDMGLYPSKQPQLSHHFMGLQCPTRSAMPNTASANAAQIQALNEQVKKITPFKVS